MDSIAIWIITIFLSDVDMSFVTLFGLSGITTTGATVIENLEGKSLEF